MGQTEISKERLMNNVDALVTKAFDGHMTEIIKIMARFPVFDWKNQLLIWKQCPDAHCIAGAEAFKVAGRTVNSDSQPIMLLYPKFFLSNTDQIKGENGLTCQVDTKTGEKIPDVYPVFNFDYIPVVAYDISNTTGDEDLSMVKDIDIEKTLKEQGFKIMSVPADDLGPAGRYKDGIIEGGMDVGGDANDISAMIQTEVIFCIDEELQGLKRQNKLIEMFCKYAMDQSIEEDNVSGRLFDDNTEPIARNIIIHIVQQYFGNSIDAEGSIGVLYKALSDLSDEDKKRFLRRISKDASDAILMFDKRYLKFNEVALANQFIRSHKACDNEPGFVVGLLMFLLNAVSDSIEDFKEDISSFCEEVYGTELNIIDKLYRLVKDQKLYTYPPVVLNAVSVEEPDETKSGIEKEEPEKQKTKESDDLAEDKDQVSGEEDKEIRTEKPEKENKKSDENDDKSANPLGDAVFDDL